MDAAHQNNPLPARPIGNRVGRLQLVRAETLTQRQRDEAEDVGLSYRQAKYAIILSGEPVLASQLKKFLARIHQVVRSLPVGSPLEITRKQVASCLRRSEFTRDAEARSAEQRLRRHLRAAEAWGLIVPCGKGRWSVLFCLTPHNAHQLMLSARKISAEKKAKNPYLQVGCVLPSEMQICRSDWQSKSRSLCKNTSKSRKSWTLQPREGGRFVAPKPQVLPDQLAQASLAPQGRIPRQIVPCTDVAAARAHLAELAAREGQAQPESGGVTTPPGPQAASPACPPPKPSRPAAVTQLLAAELHPPAKQSAPGGQVVAPSPSNRDFELPLPDEVVPDVVLRAIACRSKHLAPLAMRRWYGTGRRWRHWQAGIAAACAMAPGSVDCFAAVVASVAGSVARGKAADPRGRPGFFVHAGWGPLVIALSGVGPGAVR